MIVSVVCPKGHSHEYTKVELNLRDRVVHYYCPVCNEKYLVPLLDMEAIINTVNTAIESKIKEGVIKDESKPSTGGSSANLKERREG